MYGLTNDASMKQTHDPALTLAPFGRWTLREMPLRSGKQGLMSVRGPARNFQGNFSAVYRRGAWLALP